MLDHYLNVVSEQMQKEAALASFVDRLSLLPPGELARVRQTGEIKLAFCDDEWLQKFHGSPLAQKAIELAEQQLRMDAEQSSQREEFDAEREGLRLEKRLLELELAKAEAGVSSPAPAATPLPSAGGSPPMTAPPSEAAPPTGSKMASSKKRNPYDDIVTSPSGQAALASAGIHALHSLSMGRGAGEAALSGLGGYITGRTAGEIGERSRTLAGAGVGGAASSLLPALLLSSRPGMHILTSAGAGMYGHHKTHEKEASAEADAWGRALARGELERIEDVEKMASLGQSMLTFAKKNPALVAGGLLGAAHGAAREDGGLGSAILEGAGGAAVGGAAHLALRHYQAAGGIANPMKRLGAGPAPISAGEGINEKLGSMPAAEEQVQEEPTGRRIPIAPFALAGGAIGAGLLARYGGRVINKKWPSILEKIKNIQIPHENGSVSAGEIFNPYVPKDEKYLDPDALRPWAHRLAQGYGSIYGGIGGLAAGTGVGVGVNHLLGPREENKTASMRNIADSAIGLAKKYPLALVGAGLGAAHGALQEDGGPGSALVEGAAGGAIGAGIHHLFRGGLTSPWRDGKGGGGGGGDSPWVPPQLPQGGIDPFEELRREAQRQRVKVAFGAALASGVAKAMPAVTGWLKSNPLKAGLGAVSAISNFHQARQSGDSLGGALLSGAGGAAGAAL